MKLNIYRKNTYFLIKGTLDVVFISLGKLLMFYLNIIEKFKI